MRMEKTTQQPLVNIYIYIYLGMYINNFALARSYTLCGPHARKMKG